MADAQGGDGTADLAVGAGTGSRATGYLGTNLVSSGTPATAFDFDVFPGTTGGVFVG